MLVAYKESRSKDGKLNTDDYIRRVASQLSFWTPAIPMESDSILLYELVEVFKGLLSVYGNFTSPIMDSWLKRLSEAVMQKKVLWS